MGTIDLVDRHHNSHHVFAVHDGGCEHIFGLVLCESVHKVTEVAVLDNKTHLFIVYLIQTFFTFISKNIIDVHNACSAFTQFYSSLTLLELNCY